MAWILPKGSTIYEKVLICSGARYDPIKTTTRDRKIDDETYEIGTRNPTGVWGGTYIPGKRGCDYLPCTGGYCKVDDLVKESSMPAKPAKASKTKSAPKTRKTSFRTLFCKGSEWKFSKDCKISIYREYPSNELEVWKAPAGSKPALLEEIKETISADVCAGVKIKPLSKTEMYFPLGWTMIGGVVGSGPVVSDFSAVPVEIGDFKPGKEVKDGVERKVRYLVNIDDIKNLVEQSNDFKPKSYVIEIDGEMYQENIYGGHPSKSEFVHMNPNPARSATSWVTNLGIGCTSQYTKAKKYKTLQAAKAGIMYMTGYTEGADGIDYWSEGGGFATWEKKWKISTWDKTTKTKVDDVDVTEWVYDLFKYRSLVQEYGAGTREIIKRLQAGEKFEAVMVLERWDEGAPVYDELLSEEKAEISNLLKETILDKSQYLIRSKESSVTIGFKSIGDAMMFKLSYSGSLGIRMFDLEKMSEVL